MTLDDEATAAALVREILAGNVLQNNVAEGIELDCVGPSGERMESALMEALENPDTNDFDVGVIVAAGMLRKGTHLPNWLATFAADVLEGKRTRPTRRGPDPYGNWKRDYALAYAVLVVSTRFDVPQYTKNELSNKITAAQIVAENAPHSLDVVHKAIQKFGGIVSGVTSPQVTKD